MLHGSKKSINIFFPIYNGNYWIGGINYYKNLFQAVNMTQSEPKFELYIPKENPEILYNYATRYKGLNRDIKYRFEKLFYLIKGKKFDKKMYEEKVKHGFFDIFSHDNHPKRYFLSVGWIPDFQHIRLPKMFSADDIKYRNELYGNMAQNSKLVILSSKDALNDYKEFAPKYAHKGRILHFVSYINPSIYENTKTNSQTIKQELKLPEKYFYVPNQFWKHKNHIVILKAINLLKKQGVDITVLFSGNISDYRNKEYFDNLVNYIKENDLQNNVQILGIIDLDDVHFLMRHCVSLINPSLFEGWSTVVEEAKSLGKNIVLSNLNVHKEQDPPEGIYFDPNNHTELAHILKEKWDSKESAPDYHLEKAAKENMDSRMKLFGENYKKIILEALG